MWTNAKLLRLVSVIFAIQSHSSFLCVDNEVHVPVQLLSVMLPSLL